MIYNKGTINNNNTIILIYNENDDHQNTRVISTNSFQVVCKKPRIKETTMITLWAYQCLVSNNWCPLFFFVGAPLAEALTVDEDGLCLCGLSVRWPSRGKSRKQPGPPPFKDPKVATIQQENPVSEPTYPKIIGVTCWAQRMAWWYLDTLITPN